MKIKMYVAVVAFVLAPAPAAAASGAVPHVAARQPTPTSASASASASVTRPDSAPGEWLQPGFGPGNTHYNAAESRLNAATIGRVQQRWMLTVRSTRCDIGVLPVVSGGRLFSTDPGGIGAYDPATGGRKWHLDLPATTVSRLALADGKLLVLSSECRTPARSASRLTAFDPATGRRLWSTGLRGFSYDMRVDRGTAVLDSGPDTVAYRVADGGLRWLRKGERGEGLVSAGGRLLLRRAAGGAVAVEVTSGRSLWATKANWFAVGTDPAGTRFYVAGTGLSAVDAATGRAIWSTGLHVSDITADRTHVFYSQYRSAVCLDARTGRKVYSVHTPAAAGRSVRAGGLLYVPTGYGSPLSVADAGTGAVRAVHVIPSETNHPPVVAGGWLYVSDGKTLRAYY